MEASMPEHTPPESGFDRVRAIWRRRRWVALAVFLALVAASLSFAMSLPGLYRSTATVLVQRPQVVESFVRPTVTGELDARLMTISQEILSRARLEELISRFELYPNLRGSGEGAIEQMRKDIQLEPKAVSEPGGRAATTVGFALSYRGRDPRTVADVTNALAGLYVEQNAKIRERQATGTTEFLKGQLADMKSKLDVQERRIANLPRDATAERTTLEGLYSRMRMNGDRQLRAVDRRERLIAAALRDTGARDPAAAPGADPLGARLTKLKTELAELKTRFSEKYPDVIRVRAEIADLEREIAETPKPVAVAAEKPPKPAAPGKDPVAEIDAELETLKNEERGLRQSIAGYERRLENAPRIEQEFQRQARDYVTTKEMYESLLKRYEDAQIAESMEQGQRGEQFRVLDHAMPARSPMAPNRARLAVTGFMLSMGLAVGAVVLAETVDSSFHTPDEVRGFTRVPLLASIPRITTERDRVRRHRRRQLVGGLAIVAMAFIGAAVYVAVHHNDQLVRLLSPTMPPSS
jgi:polysaccharide biosynthesis transport protein